MRLQKCTEHEDCTLVDGVQHATRREVPPIEGLATEDAVSKGFRNLSDRIHQVEKQAGEAVVSARADAEAKDRGQSVALRAVTLAVDSLADQVRDLEGAVEASVALSKARDDVVPLKVAEAHAAASEARTDLNTLRDELNKVREALDRETSAREALARQIKEG